MAVTIDEMLKHIGEFRQYQWFLMCLLGYSLLAAGSFNGMIVTFITAEPDWKCVDGYMNNTICRFNKSIALTSDDYKARCKMPREAWTFVDDFTSTVTEYDLVCDDSILLSVAQSCFWVGMLICLLIGGYLSDKYGRRIICISGFFLNIIASVIMVFPKSFIVFIVCRIFTGFGSGLYFPAFPLLMEFTTEKYRSWITNGYFMFWSLGLMILPLIGYFSPEWRMFLLTTVVFGLPCLLFLWLIPESPRWLLINNKEEDAKNVLLKIAKMNKKKILDDDLERPVILEQRSSFTQLFSSWKVAKTTLISWDLWFTNTLVYYGVSFGSVDLGGNRYLNFFLISLVGIPANVAIMWAANRFGRKTSVLIGLVITVIASAISVSIPSDQSSAGVGGRITAAIVANFFISFSFAGVYLWTSELFPTVIRATGMSTSSSFGRIGSFAASYIIWLILYLISFFSWRILVEEWIRIHAALPFSIMGAFALQAAVLGLFLPETKGVATMETMDDMKTEKEQGVALLVNGDGKTEKNENTKITI